MIEYDESRPIYLQVADYCLQQIESGQWLAESKIPSTKELAVTLGVNNRTIIKAYEELEAIGLVRVVRGQGYFCNSDVADRLRDHYRRQFEDCRIPDFLSAAEHCGYTLDDVLSMLELRR